MWTCRRHSPAEQKLLPLPARRHREPRGPGATNSPFQAGEALEQLGLGTGEPGQGRELPGTCLSLSTCTAASRCSEHPPVYSLVAIQVFAPYSLFAIYFLFPASFSPLISPSALHFLLFIPFPPIYLLFVTKDQSENRKWPQASHNDHVKDGARPVTTQNVSPIFLYSSLKQRGWYKHSYSPLPFHRAGIKENFFLDTIRIPKKRKKKNLTKLVW